MIKWLHEEDGYCEGCFKSEFFRDDEGKDELCVYVNRPDLKVCAEKCVGAFNHLTETQIDEICKGIIKSVRENSRAKGFELPEPGHALDILDSCWFTALYVNMLEEDDEIAYVVEGEGDWGEEIGFAVKNNEVVYVGMDYMDCMEGEA